MSEEHEENRSNWTVRQWTDYAKEGTQTSQGHTSKEQTSKEHGSKVQTSGMQTSKVQTSKEQS